MSLHELAFTMILAIDVERFLFFAQVASKKWIVWASAVHHIKRKHYWFRLWITPSKRSSTVKINDNSIKRLSWITSKRWWQWSCLVTLLCVPVLMTLFEGIFPSMVRWRYVESNIESTEKWSACIRWINESTADLRRNCSTGVMCFQ